MSDQLAAIDDALETGAADHHDPLTRELQELALALRADAPEADPDFQRRLRGRVEAGFPKPPRSRGRRPLWRRISNPAFATGVVVLPLVLIVVVAGGSEPSDQDDGGGGGGGGGRERRRQRRQAERRRGAPDRRARPPSARSARPARCAPRTRRAAARLPWCFRPTAASPRPAQPQDRALDRAGAGDARRSDGAGGRAGDHGHEPARRLRAELVGLDRRGVRRRRLRAAHPLRPAASRPARPGGARGRAYADPDRPRRHARARDREGPPPGRARGAPQPAAPARAGYDRRGGRGDPPPARHRGGRDQRSALAAARSAAAHGLRRRDGEPASQGRRQGRRRRAARSTTRSATPATCSWAWPE